jgi:hypothetical protein
MDKNKLPDKVVNALLSGKKIEAIKLLRAAQGLGLKEAKERVEAYCKQDFPQSEAANRKNLKKRQRKPGLKTFILPGVVLLLIVWAMVNIPRMAGNVIVLINREGYRKAIFTIHNVLYDNDPEAGLLWGFYGSLPNGKTLRMCAPELASAKSLGFSGLKSRFPAGTRMEVWYNPGVTDTFFQYRTLNVIPHNEDLASSELKGVIWWVTYCLFPLLVVLIYASIREKRVSRRAPQTK